MPADLVSFGQAIGFEVPSELRALWSIHDGQAGQGEPGTLAELEFLSIDRALAEWRDWAEVRRSTSELEMRSLRASCRSRPPLTIRREYTWPGWIPVWKEPMEGNYLGVDLDPGERGTVGQVINFGRDEDEKAVVASSLGELLEFVREETRRGAIRAVEVTTKRGARLSIEHEEGRFITLVRVAAEQRLGRPA